MRLTVHLFGDLRRYLPKGQELIRLEIADATTVSNLLSHLRIDPSEVWVVRANKQVVSEESTLNDGDDIEVFEPIGGG
ncbi:MAG TPA: MoaD/ThiS family protein [Chloroflexota bacterium]|nr:MoaD/ThiS family protein [Chloroflexota bacterium]